LIQEVGIAIPSVLNKAPTNTDSPRCCHVAEDSIRVAHCGIKIVAVDPFFGFKHFDIYTLTINVVAAEHNGSTPLIPKPTTASDPEPVPSTSHNHNLFP